ncbi:MAG: DUF3617 domain-containing protein [Casimicrobiaceae bacterium]
MLIDRRVPIRTATSRFAAPPLILFALLLVLLAPLPPASAQTAGLWRYTIATDLSTVPSDMRVNFPTVRFEACLTDADFASGRAFSIQPTPGSVSRCQTTDLTRDGATVSLRFACDDGKTLSGSARGTVSARRFVMELDNRYDPPVSGIGMTRQTMSASYLGECKKP